MLTSLSSVVRLLDGSVSVGRLAVRARLPARVLIHDVVKLTFCVRQLLWGISFILQCAPLFFFFLGRLHRSRSQSKRVGRRGASIGELYLFFTTSSAVKDSLYIYLSLTLRDSDFPGNLLFVRLAATVRASGSK